MTEQEAREIAEKKLENSHVKVGAFVGENVFSFDFECIGDERCPGISVFKDDKTAATWPT